MNERIKELSDEAWRYVDGISGLSSSQASRAQEQKFAELIVQECCQVVADIPVDALEPDYKILADHFGVDFERDWS